MFDSILDTYFMTNSVHKMRLNLKAIFLCDFVLRKKCVVFWNKCQNWPPTMQWRLFFLNGTKDKWDCCHLLDIIELSLIGIFFIFYDKKLIIMTWIYYIYLPAFFRIVSRTCQLRLPQQRNLNFQILNSSQQNELNNLINERVLPFSIQVWLICRPTSKLIAVHDLLRERQASEGHTN